MKNLRLPADVAVDAQFTRTNQGVTMTARFAVVDPCRELSWTGSALGTKAVHRFTLEATGDETQVTVAGWPVRCSACCSATPNCKPGWKPAWPG